MGLHLRAVRHLPLAISPSFLAENVEISVKLDAGVGLVGRLDPSSPSQFPPPLRSPHARFSVSLPQNKKSDPSCLYYWIHTYDGSLHVAAASEGPGILCLCIHLQRFGLANIRPAPSYPLAYFADSWLPHSGCVQMKDVFRTLMEGTEPCVTITHGCSTHMHTHIPSYGVGKPQEKFWFLEYFQPHLPFQADGSLCKETIRVVFTFLPCLSQAPFSLPARAYASPSTTTNHGVGCSTLVT